MRSIVLAICMLACVALPAQKWHAFTSSKGAFAVTFPAAPDVKEITRQTPEGFSVTSHMHITLKEPVSAFVIYNQFESGINIEDDSIYLNTVTQEMMAKFSNKFENAKADVKDIEFEGYPGKSFTLEVDGVISDIRVILG